MATSGSLEKRREKKPESVHFWLAIVAGSLLVHSLLMFGVSRSIKVSVVEPAVSGAIDVEIVDPLGREVVAGEEPIVPAAAFKPEPFSPEPTPLPEFSPEPTPEPSVKPELKSEPIVPTPRPSSTPKGPKSTPTSPRSTPSPIATPSTIPIPRPSGLNGNDSKTRSFIPSNVTPQQMSTGGVDDRQATLVLSSPFPPLVMSSDFAKDIGKTMLISLTFIVDCANSKGLDCPSDQIKISYSNHGSDPQIDREAYFSELDREIKAWTTKLKASSLVYQPDPVGTTDARKKPPTYWNMQVQLQVKN